MTLIGKHQKKKWKIISQKGNDGEHYSEMKIDPSLTLRRRDGKTMNLKDYINKFKTPKPNDDETKTY